MTLQLSSVSACSITDKACEKEGVTCGGQPDAAGGRHDAPALSLSGNSGGGVKMSPEQNFKIPAASRLLLTRGLVMLAMLLIIFSLSCQAIPPREEGVVPEKEPVLTPEPGLTPTTAAVKISGFAFLPATITIPAGTTVTWLHDDSPPHTVSSREAVFDSGILSRGATFSYTFTRDGTFEYRCKIHPYMTAKIIVGEGGAVSPAEGTTPEREAPLGGGGSDY